MKQFQVTEKDGQKWLQPINVPYPNEDEYEDGNDPGPYSARADAFIYKERTTPVIYLGSLPVGSLVDESKIREVRQHKLGGKWHITTSDLADTSFSDYWELETRTAYTDVEQSHDRHISADKCVAGCAAYDGGEVRHHPDCPFYPESFTRMHDYWKSRCEAAEKFIAESPCDPDIYADQIDAYDKWQELVKSEKTYGDRGIATAPRYVAQAWGDEYGVYDADERRFVGNPLPSLRDTIVVTEWYNDLIGEANGN